MRIVPKEKTEGLRLGQLLICALEDAGHLRQSSVTVASGFRVDPNNVEHSMLDQNICYEVVGVDLFYLENDELEEILQKFLAKHYNHKRESNDQVGDSNVAP